MEAADELKYFGLAVFVILLCGLIFVLRKWPQDERLTFSQHVAVHKMAIIYYVALFSIALPLLLAFFIGWFVPTFKLSVWFTILLILSSAAQLLSTLVPETRGWKIKFHRFISGFSGILLIPALFLLLISDYLGGIEKAITLFGIIAMASVVGILMINKKETFTPSFIHQSVYYAGFFIPILVVSYF